MLESGTDKAFEYMQAMTVIGVYPTLGQMQGGQAISVFGDHFTPSGLQCKFGDVPAIGTDVRWKTSSLILCISPSAMQESRVQVEVSANGGADYTNNQKFFLYHAAITIEQLVPSRGFAMTRNQAVTILGYNFAEAADLVCTFGLNDTVIGARLSPEKVRCSVPEREAGRVRVTVSYSYGSRGQQSSALYIYVNIF
jgi:hypothetical protein